MTCLQWASFRLRNNLPELKLEPESGAVWELEGGMVRALECCEKLALEYWRNARISKEACIWREARLQRGAQYRMNACNPRKARIQREARHWRGAQYRKNALNPRETHIQKEALHRRGGAVHTWADRQVRKSTYNMAYELEFA